MNTEKITESGQVYLHHDDVSNRLDEMADLCEHWKKWRNERDCTPTAVRSALVMLAREIVMLADWEQKTDQSLNQLTVPNTY